jgi:excinuclease ABC subunit C
MITAPEAVAAKLPHLPDSPGVYLWKDADGKVLYVGKAKRLRSRVRSYFASDHPASPKTRGLVRNVQDLETIVVPTEAHALILEANLIKEYRPRFNIALKDDKNYPYIKVTVQEPYPRVFVTRRLQSDGARYFGPYTDVGRMRQALNVVKRIFTVRSCNYDMPREMPERACLDFAIKRCKAPCIGNQSLEDYRAMVDEVTVFLDGKTDEVVRRISARMEEASERLDFERAGELRDALRHLQRMQEPTVVLELEGGDRDVVGYARDGDDACVAVMRIRGGKLLARDHRFLENIDEGDDDPIVLAAFLARSYLGGAEERADELLVPFDFDDRPALEESLARTRVLVPQRGSRRQLVDLAEQNARHLLEEYRLAGMEAEERAADPVYELQRELGLKKVPRSLVCFDISHAQGTDTVASCVWFENARAKRAEYRKFKVETVQGIDDFASMREVVGRYFRRRLDEERPLPTSSSSTAARASSTPRTRRSRRSASVSTRSSRWPSARRRCSSSAAPNRCAFPPLARAAHAPAGARRGTPFAVTFQRKRRRSRTVTSSS